MPSPEALRHLSPDARNAIDTVTNYYRQQTAFENDRECFDEILDWVRQSCSCLALAGELTAETRQELVQLLPPGEISSELNDCEAAASALEHIGHRLVGTDTDRQADVDQRTLLPENEQLRQGDRVEVYPQKEDEQRYGTFLRYSDPRIGDPKRRAWILPDSGNLALEVPPERLRFAPRVESYAEHYDHLRTWRQDGFELQLYDTGREDRHGKSRLAFEFRDWLHEHGSYPLFHGNEFSCSPLNSVDSNAAVAAVLSFLCLRPGDTDDEYFADYTSRHFEWCEERAEALLMLVLELEKRSSPNDG